MAPTWQMWHCYASLENMHGPCMGPPMGPPLFVTSLENVPGWAPGTNHSSSWSTINSIINLSQSLSEVKSEAQMLLTQNNSRVSMLTISGPGTPIPSDTIGYHRIPSDTIGYHRIPLLNWYPWCSVFPNSWPHEGPTPSKSFSSFCRSLGVAAIAWHTSFCNCLGECCEIREIQVQTCGMWKYVEFENSKCHSTLFNMIQCYVFVGLNRSELFADVLRNENMAIYSTKTLSPSNCCSTLDLLQGTSDKNTFGMQHALEGLVWTTSLLNFLKFLSSVLESMVLRKMDLAVCTCRVHVVYMSPSEPLASL